MRREHHRSGNGGADRRHRPAGGWRLTVADAGVAAAATAVMLVAALESGDQPARPVDGWTVAALAAVGLFSGLSRRAPRTALVGAAITFVAALATGVPGFSPALALGVPIFMVGWVGQWRWGSVALVAVGAGGPGYRLLEAQPEPLGQVALSTLFDLSLLAVLLLLGEALHSRRALRAEAALRLRMAAHEHQRRHTEQRLRTARDLHDILSHTLALVGIQANVAAEHLPGEPDRAGQAVAQVQAATREAMADLRSTIAVLREEPAPGGGLAPAPGLADLPTLVEAVRAAGLAATLQAPGPAPAAVRLRPAVELAIYRVVQESLTNTLRHAGARSVAVVVEQDQERVRVEVRDDGQGGSGAAVPAPPAAAGSGLQGMAERVAALGGTLWSGPHPDGAAGYTVRASLPAGEPR